MNQPFSLYQGCEPDVIVCPDPAFVRLLQQGLLLALREQGTLTAMQYRHAEEKLRRQHP